MNPLIGSALIGGAVNMIGGLFGKKSADNSVQVQRQIAQQQIASQERINQLNLQEAERNRQFQQDSIDNQNAWNSAKSQVNRYREAGLNPYLMMQNGGQVVSASGASGAQATLLNADKGYEILSSAEANKQANIQSFVQNTQRAVSDYFNFQQIKVQSQKAVAEFSEILQRTDDDHVRKEVQNALDNALAVLHGDMLLTQQLQRDVMVQQIQSLIHTNTGLDLDNKIKEIALLYEDEKQQASVAKAWADLDSVFADIFLKYQQGYLTYAQARHEFVKVGLTRAQTKKTYSDIDVNNSIIAKNNEDVKSQKIGGFLSYYVGTDLGGKVSAGLNTLFDNLVDAVGSFMEGGDSPISSSLPRKSNYKLPRFSFEHLGYKPRNVFGFGLSPTEYNSINNNKGFISPHTGTGKSRRMSKFPKNRHPGTGSRLTPLDWYR